VNVTAWPTCDGFNEEVRAVVVVALVTVCRSGAELLGRKVESPE